MRYLPFTHPSHFLRERDFGQKIETSFDFVRAHFKPLGKALLYIVLPVTLFIGLLSAVLALQWMSSITALQGTKMDKTNPWPGIATLFSGMFLSTAYIGILLGGLVLLTVLVLTVYGYITLRMETPPDEEVTVSAVWQLVKQRFLGTALALVGLGLGLGLVSMAVSIVGGVLSALLIGTGSSAMTGFAVVLMMFLIFGATTYASVALSLFLIILVRERLGFFATIGRSFRLIWGKWWSTFGLLTVMLIICMMLMLALILVTSLISSPFSLAQSNGQLEGAARVGFILSNVITSLASLIIYPLVLVALAFQYFNLVERKEGESLHYLVDALGQPAPESVPQALRPDDEGEY